MTNPHVPHTYTAHYPNCAFLASSGPCNCAPGRKASAEPKPNDPVTRPAHYTAGAVECIDAIRAALGDDGFVAYCRGAAIKYAWRSGRKANHAEDLRKGAWYLTKAAEALNGKFAQSDMGASINPLISVPKDAWEDFCRKNGLPLGIYREAIADLQRDANNPRKGAE